MTTAVIRDGEPGVPRTSIMDGWPRCRETDGGRTRTGLARGRPRAGRPRVISMMGRGVDRWQTRDGATARSFGETLETRMSARTHDIRVGERDSQPQNSTSGDTATGHDHLVSPAGGRPPCCRSRSLTLVFPPDLIRFMLWSSARGSDQMVAESSDACRVSNTVTCRSSWTCWVLGCLTRCHPT